MPPLIHDFPCPPVILPMPTGKRILFYLIANQDPEIALREIELQNRKLDEESISAREKHKIELMKTENEKSKITFDIMKFIHENDISEERLDQLKRMARMAME